jgi:dTDP-4-amino-4,6-dideoxygalactose transaminase
MHAEVAAELDAAWRQVTASCGFIGGAAVERFESEWAEYCGTRHCVGVSDGTAALELALRALGIGAGDEVIVPANTFVATVEAVVATGARPVMVDVDPRTLLLTAEHVAAACTPRTAAAIPVHLFGQPVDMDAIDRVAARTGIAVIEDAAQAHGATWRGRRAGGLADIGCFSFYPGKNLGAFGDAGAIVTNRRELAERIRILANHGRDLVAAERHVRMGRNQRLDGLQAAVLSVKLARLETWNAGRRRAAETYRQLLAGLPAALVEVADDAVSSHHLAVVQVEGRDAVRRHLADRKIGTGIHYAIPCHRQPAAMEIATGSLPVVERAAGRILSLPMFPHLDDPRIARVVEALANALADVGPSATLEPAA